MGISAAATITNLLVKISKLKINIV